MSALDGTLVDVDMLSAHHVFAAANKPKLTILRDIAEHYWHDARDFVERFDCLRERVSTRSGRVKNCVDLRMACECALKTHALLVGSDESAYENVRKAGHDLERLASFCFSPLERDFYCSVAKHAAIAKVDVRYSHDADRSFFAWKIVAGSSGADYALTLGNALWVQQLRDDVGKLIDSVRGEFTGLGQNEIEEIFDLDMKMATFMSTKGKGKS